jgi:type II secretion system protein D
MGVTPPPLLNQQPGGEAPPPFIPQEQGQQGTVTGPARPVTIEPPQTQRPPAETGQAPVREGAPQPPAQPQPVQTMRPVPQPQSQVLVQPQPQVPGGAVSFFFDDADIFEVVQTIFGEVLKVNYLIDQRVKGKVNFRTVTPIPKNEVLSVMETILRINGVGFVEEKGLYRIVPLTEVPKELVYSQVGKDPENVAIEMFTFKNVNIRDSMTDIENAVGLTVSEGKVRVLPIYRLNALLVVASTKEQMNYVRRWVETFDNLFADARPKVMVYPLQNSKASPIASMLQSILSGGGGGTSAPAPSTPAPAPRTPTPGAAPTAPAVQPPRTGAAATAAGTGFLVSPETRVFADEINNALIILATPADYAFIEETIKKLDMVQRQVVIEALIVRVELTDNLSFGFRWGLSTDISIKGFKPFKRDINLRGDVSDNPGLAADPTTGNLAVPSKGFTFIGTDPTGNVRAVMTALAEESKAKVLAAPHILVADNREARIQVGSQVPLSTSTTTTPLSTTGTTTTPTFVNTSTSTIQYKDIGIILKVKPQVNDSGLVSLELTQEVSSIGSNVKIAGQDFASIDKEEVTSNLVAQDGETIIIGGLIREDTTKAKDGIPFLNKIPILGNLFGGTTNSFKRSEIIVLLTPRVIKNLEDAGAVTTDYIEKYKTGAKDKEIEKFIEERGQKEKSGKDEGENGSPKE